MSQSQQELIVQQLRSYIETAKNEQSASQNSQESLTLSLSFSDGYGGAFSRLAYSGPSTPSAGTTFTSGFNPSSEPDANPDAAGSDCMVRDCDLDGLRNDLEEALADGFTPYYHVSAGEKPGTGFATFFDNPNYQIVNQVFGPTPPISNYRVMPLGFVWGTDNVQYGLIQIDYLTLWNRDDGVEAGALCYAYAGILGLLVDELGNHDLDNERSAVLVAAPVIAPNTYSRTATDYKAYAFFTAAHEDTFFDKSRLFYVDTPVPYNGHILLGLAQQKHATYTFNPNYLPLFPNYVIYATYASIVSAYEFGIIDHWTYQAYLYAADTVFYLCFVERFSDQGGTYAGTRTNVGELSHPVNWSSYILSPGLRQKLLKRF